MELIGRQIPISGRCRARPIKGVGFSIAMGAMIAAVLLAFTAFGATADTNAAERGRQLFQLSCGFCHGADATGSSGPDLIRSALVGQDGSGNLIGLVIKSGRP